MKYTIALSIPINIDKNSHRQLLSQTLGDTCLGEVWCNKVMHIMGCIISIYVNPYFERAPVSPYENWSCKNLILHLLKAFGDDQM